MYNLLLKKFFVPPTTQAKILNTERSYKRHLEALCWLFYVMAQSPNNGRATVEVKSWRNSVYLWRQRSHSCTLKFAKGQKHSAKQSYTHPLKELIKKRWILFVRFLSCSPFSEHSNFEANQNIKTQACDQRAICFHLSEHAKNENESRTRWFWRDTQNFLDLWALLLHK